MSDLELLTYYLGIEVRQDSIGITVYLCSCLTPMEDCNSCPTPMETRLHLIKASIEALVDVTEYRNLVGAVRYLVHIRPDLAHSISYESRFMAEPHDDHKAAVKRVLRYIAGTRDHGVHYARGKVGELLLLDYSDKDHGGDIKDNKSTSGICSILKEIQLLGDHRIKILSLSPPTRLSI
jgi:hypothetical protein